MKKIFALALVLLFATAVSSLANTGDPNSAQEGKSLYANVSAAPTNTTDAGVTLIGKWSKGVYGGWNTDAQGYAITTMHISGNRAFGSSHDATAIYRNDAKPTTAPAAAGFDFAAGWTAM